MAKKIPKKVTAKKIPVTKKTVKKTTSRLPKKAVSKAVNMYEKFNHYEAENYKTIDIPLEKVGLAEIGRLVSITYRSDKAIFASDIRKGQLKIRDYKHDVEQTNKTPVYLSGDGKYLLIKLAKVADGHGIKG